MPQESAQGKTYTIATLLNVLDISRGTLRYYEQIGLVRPERDPETGYRSYSNDDVFRVATCYMLKNAGFSVQDAQTLISKIHDAPELIDMLWQENERQRVWHETMCKTLSVLRKLCLRSQADSPEPELVLSEPYLVYLDSCEGGYENFTPDVGLDALMRCMPISSFGSVLAEDILLDELGLPQWGRVVPERWAHLLPELARSGITPRHVGGGPCVIVPYVVPSDSIPGFDRTHRVRDSLKSFMQEKGLAQNGPAFTAHALPVCGTFYAIVYVPVKGTRLGSKLKLAAMQRRRGIGGARK